MIFLPGWMYSHFNYGVSARGPSEASGKGHWLCSLAGYKKVISYGSADEFKTRNP